MKTLEDLQKLSAQLQNNLVTTTGQLEILIEQKQVIREELSNIQGKIELLMEQQQEKPT